MIYWLLKETTILTYKSRHSFTETDKRTYQRMWFTKINMTREALNKISEERETILTRHKEWISLLTVLSQKCHSKLKCGSENARPQEPFKLEEVHQVERDFNLNHSLKNKIFILKKTSERADLEYF